MIFMNSVMLLLCLYALGHVRPNSERFCDVACKSKITLVCDIAKYAKYFKIWHIGWGEKTGSGKDAQETDITIKYIKVLVSTLHPL